MCLLVKTCSEKWASQVTPVVKNPPAHAGGIEDLGSIAGPGSSPGGGNGNPFQDSHLENPMDGRSPAGYSPWGHQVGHDRSNLARTHTE